MNKITLLKSYINKKINFGSNIRYLLADENGNSLFCYECSNIANNVLVCRRKYTFNIPFCKKHFEKIFPEGGNFIVENEVRKIKERPKDQVEHYNDDGETWIVVTLKSGYKQAFFIDFGEKELIRICKKMESEGVVSRK